MIWEIYIKAQCEPRGSFLKRKGGDDREKMIVFSGKKTPTSSSILPRPYVTTFTFFFSYFLFQNFFFLDINFISVGERRRIG
jgi:hypothetical protein